MSITTEREILDRLYSAIREAKLHASLASDPARLRMLVTNTTDYDRLYAAMELIEGCARQMTAWREDTRWEAVSLTVGICLTRLRTWATPEFLPLFQALVGFMEKTEWTCRNLEHQATHRLGAILPDEHKVETPRNSHQVRAPNAPSSVLLQ